MHLLQAKWQQNLNIWIYDRIWLAAVMSGDIGGEPGWWCSGTCDWWLVRRRSPMTLLVIFGGLTDKIGLWGVACLKRAEIEIHYCHVTPPLAKEWNQQYGNVLQGWKHKSIIIEERSLQCHRLFLDRNTILMFYSMNPKKCDYTTLMLLVAPI